VTGTGLYEATSVGEASLANRITTGARTFRRVLTPLQKQVNLVVRVLLAIMVSLQLLLVVRALVQNVSLPDAVANATVLAGLVPNGLFLSIAIAYALGSVRLVRFGALVQQSNAVESLSNVDTLVLDKTGTLTANRLKVAGVYAPDERAEKRLVDSLASLAASATASNKTGHRRGLPRHGPTGVGGGPFFLCSKMERNRDADRHRRHGRARDAAAISGMELA
jgi:cation-transporting ATPase E